MVNRLFAPIFIVLSTLPSAVLSTLPSVSLSTLLSQTLFFILVPTDLTAATNILSGSHRLKVISKICLIFCFDPSKNIQDLFFLDIKP